TPRGASTPRSTGCSCSRSSATTTRRCPREGRRRGDPHRPPAPARAPGRGAPRCGGRAAGGRARRGGRGRARAGAGAAEDAAMTFAFDLTPGALTYCQAKLTWVGPQSKPIPSLVFSTFHRIPQLDAFARLRTSGLGYGNDEHAVWHFAVEPREAARVLERLSGVVERRGDDAPALSLMVIPGRDDGSFETLLDL